PSARSGSGLPGSSLSLVRGRSLAHNLARVLVVAQAQEARVAESPVAGPLAEPHLHDQLGLDPCHVPATQVGLDEGRPFAPQRPQAAREVAERLTVETRADLARVAQPPVLEVPDEQRAEIHARALRCREATHHQLLLRGALGLAP